MSNNTHISFYLSSYRIHIFRETIQAIGNPGYVRFLVNREAGSMILQACGRKMPTSHKVVTDCAGGMEIKSFPFCSVLAKEMNWNDTFSYRIPGQTFPDQHIAVFDLTGAEPIGRNDERQEAEF